MGVLLFIVAFLVANTLMGLGNTMGYHRLLTHRSYACPRWMFVALTLLGALHGGSPMVWVGLHRLHHTKSDGPGDPHSTRDGFWHAHCGWLIGANSPWICVPFALSGFGQQGRLLWHDIRRVRGKNPPIWQDACPDLMKDPLMRFLDTPFVQVGLFLVEVIAVTLVAGGWGLLWLWSLHLVLTNGSWAVNSVGHWRAFGKESFENGDDSRDVWWLAAVTWGEGWHNGHHRYPRSAKHGLAGGVDMSWLIIRGLERVGLVWDVWLPKAHRGDKAPAA